MKMQEVLSDFDTDTTNYVIVGPLKHGRKLAIRAQIHPQYFDEIKSGLEKTLNMTLKRYDDLKEG